MILHPPVIALLVGSAITSVMVLLASWDGVRILRHWDLASGSERQLALERRTYLVSTVMSYACGFQVVSLFLFIYTADDIAPLLVGAMCAAGTLAANAYGYPTLIVMVAAAILAGAWLILNHADIRGRDYPLIRKKYKVLLAIAPVMLAGTVLQGAYFGGLHAEVITSCCGSLFSTTAPGFSSEIASLPGAPMKVAFYGVIAALVGSGIWFVRRASGGYVVALLSVLAFVVSIAALISFISLYIYELPTHHCPFCILQREYHFIGYPMYGLLLTGVVAGLGLGMTYSSRHTPSLASVLLSLQRRLSVIAVVAFGAFAALSTYLMLATSFTLQGS
jgi:hypothetical protein